MHSMIDIAAYKRSLLFHARVPRGVAGPWLSGIMIVVAPLCEVVREFQAGCVGRGILEVDDHKLFVGVLGKQEWRWGLSCRGRLGD